MDINDPTLPRRRKIPRRLDDRSEQSFPETVEQHYSIVYFEAQDLMIACVSNCFDQPGYKTYSNVQNLLLKAAEVEMNATLPKTYQILSEGSEIV